MTEKQTSCYLGAKGIVYKSEISFGCDGNVYNLDCSAFTGVCVCVWEGGRERKNVNLHTLKYTIYYRSVINQ